MMDGRQTILRTENSKLPNLPFPTRRKKEGPHAKFKTRAESTPTSDATAISIDLTGAMWTQFGPLDKSTSSSSGSSTTSTSLAPSSTSSSASSGSVSPSPSPIHHHQSKEWMIKSMRGFKSLFEVDHKHRVSNGLPGQPPILSTRTIEAADSAIIRNGNAGVGSVVSNFLQPAAAIGGGVGIIGGAVKGEGGGSKSKMGNGFPWADEKSSLESLDGSQKGLLSKGSLPPRDGGGTVNKLIMEMAQYSSLHGVGWYAVTPNKCLRFTIIFVSTVLMLFMPLFIAYELKIYLVDNSVHKNQHTYRAEAIDYPNITICNPRFFKNDYLRSFNISNELANYMMLAMDTTIRKHTDFMAMSYPDGSYIKRLERLDDELQAVMRANNLTSLLDLFYLVADRCEDFVMFCEEHRKFYVTENAASYDAHSAHYPSCCGTFFHAKPFFTPAGTCFTTKATVTETEPASFSNIRIWTTLAEAQAPDLDMVLMGTDAAERDGIFWTVTYEDHPSKALFTRPRKISMGTATLVGLSKRREDRTRLTEPCLDYSDDFSSRYGLPKTRLNCLLVLSHYTVPNCSMAVYFGLKQVDGLPPCQPDDHLHLHVPVDLETVNQKKNKSSFGFDHSQCLYDCKHIYYDMTISTSKFSEAALKKFFDSGVYTQGYHAKYNTSESAVLQFYFETFDYEEHIIFEEGVDIFLSRVGGWMGLAQGGSVISLIEITFFLSILVKAFFSDCFKTVRPGGGR